MTGWGVLLHGRNLRTSRWEELILGDPPRMGSFPALAWFWLENPCDLVVAGTGASERAGVLEADFTKAFMLDQVAFLDRFPQIAAHPGAAGLRGMLEGIVPVTACGNTVTEIAEAAGVFTASGITRVMQVTNGSHAPRCINEAAKARRAGVIPAWQRWAVMPDDMDFGGDVVVTEPPHLPHDARFRAGN